METIRDNLSHIHQTVKAAQATAFARGFKQDVTLIAVSKTHPVEAIRDAYQAGLRHFAENRIQEAQEKWPTLLGAHPDITLHMVGALQSNKAGDAVALFSVIHSLDRSKLARTLAKEEKKQNKKCRYFIQVNTGSEPQKSGIDPSKALELLNLCRALDLNVIGLMCLPPLEEDPAPHFAMLKQMADELGLNALSMGMSGDFETAIAHGATHIRVGSRLFGPRRT